MRSSLQIAMISFAAFGLYFCTDLHHETGLLKTGVDILELHFAEIMLLKKMVYFNSIVASGTCS